MSGGPAEEVQRRGVQRKGGARRGGPEKTSPQRSFKNEKNLKNIDNKTKSKRMTNDNMKQVGEKGENGRPKTGEKRAQHLFVF